MAVSHDTIYKVKTDTVVTTHTDTIRVLRYSERTDTANHHRDDRQLVVKKKRGWLNTITGYLLSLALPVLVFWILRNKS